MQPLTRGHYTARLADGSPDMDAGLTLRRMCFRPGQDRSDLDGFDAACRHVLITANGAVVACFRVQLFAGRQSLSHSYAAQFYDLAPLDPQARPMLELGRFCLHPAHADPDILRLAWAALTRLVDDAQVRLLFGCSSFAGADAARHLPALGHLAHHHLGPAAIRPRRRAPGSIDLRPLADPAHAPALPPLLKTYLSMGGWVSDHAVLDRDLNTTHVFTALDIAAIPPARARALRALAQTS